MLRRWGLIVGCVFFGCGADPGPEVPPEVVEPEDRVLRPSALFELELPIKTWTLPEGFEGPKLQAETEAFVLVGGPAGLFEVGDSELRRVDERPVAALAAYGGKAFVAASGELGIFDGAVSPSTLLAALPDARVNVMAARDSELWLGTNAELLRLAGEELVAFDDVIGVTDIRLFDGSTILSLSVGGRPVLLRASEDELELQSLEDEVGTATVVFGAESRVVALRESEVFERRATDSGYVWRPSSVVLSETDPGVEGVEDAVLDSSTGRIWLLGDQLIYRLEPSGRVARLARPAGTTPARLFRVYNGVVWLAGDTALVRLGELGPATTYSGHVAPFVSQNCLRCHTDRTGVARSLETYGALSENVDRAIEQLQQGLMPEDGRALEGGTVEILERWRKGGLLP
ncbi:MAG: hypothetical protein HY791_09490 [Deltaproteobacteria bacterium]|nr:hypothetical protein [Deltaproteobacteria bacterium]